MSQPTQPASLKAIRHAEAKGLDTAYAEALEAHRALEEEQNNLVTARVGKRQFLEDISEKEAEVAINEAAMNSMSATAFKEHMKTVIALHPDLRKLREQLRAAEYVADQAESNIKQLHETIRIRTARMSELGGYLNYLAAVQAATTANAQQQYSNPPRVTNS